jgi:hypothetical protein
MKNTQKSTIGTLNNSMRALIGLNFNPKKKLTPMVYRLPAAC